MIRFLAARMLQAVFVMFGVATIVFVMVRVLGNPAVLMLPEGSSQDTVDKLSQSLGLDDPLVVQYLRYLGDLVRGDFGTSVWTGQPVLSTIGHYFPPTLYLALVSVVLALLIGVTLGAVAAARPGGIVDRVVTVVAYAGLSFPEFWLGMLLIQLFAVKLGWFPTSGYGAPIYFVLPVLTLLARPIGRLAQTTRVSLRDELGKEYVFTGLAKGLKARVVLIRHALRNSLISVLTLGGDELAALVAGAVAVEVVFAWPGTGFLSIQAIERRDTDLVVGIVLAVSAFVVVLNLLIDIAYRLVDKRIDL